MSQIKNSVHRLNSRLYTAEERIGILEDKYKENIQNVLLGDKKIEYIEG